MNDERLLRPGMRLRGAGAENGEVHKGLPQRPLAAKYGFDGRSGGYETVCGGLGAEGGGWNGMRHHSERKGGAPLPPTPGACLAVALGGARYHCRGSCDPFGAVRGEVTPLQHVRVVECGSEGMVHVVPVCASWCMCVCGTGVGWTSYTLHIQHHAPLTICYTLHHTAPHRTAPHLTTLHPITPRLPSPYCLTPPTPPHPTPPHPTSTSTSTSTSSRPYCTALHSTAPHLTTCCIPQTTH